MEEKNFMAKKRTVKITMGCEHTSETTRLDLVLPFKVTRFEEDGLWINWLSSNDSSWHLMPLGQPLECKKESTLLAKALRAYVATPKGEREALALVRHTFEPQAMAATAAAAGAR
jgi:hypothetical protein